MADFDGDIIVPDSWEPVIGYRIFNVGNRNGLLASTGISSESFWAPGVNVARCLRAIFTFIEDGEEPVSHEAPDPECRCGFYALKTPQLVMDHFGVEEWSGQMTVLWGKVAMWGLVIEGRTGYRAQYAKVVELLGMPYNIAIAQAAAKRYDVDVSLEMLTSYAWFQGGPAHGRVMPIEKLGRFTGNVYAFPIIEVVGKTPKQISEGVASGGLHLAQALYQRDGRAQVWRFRGYRR